MSKREMNPTVAQVTDDTWWVSVRLYDAESGEFMGRLNLQRKKGNFVVPTVDQIKKAFKEGYLYDLGDVAIVLSE